MSAVVRRVVRPGRVVAVVLGGEVYKVVRRPSPIVILTTRKARP